MTSLFNGLFWERGYPKDQPTPVLSCQVNAEKNFAFLEFRNVDDCTDCLGFDGVAIHGQGLSLRRPKDFRPLPGQRLDSRFRSHVPGQVADYVPDTPYKIFVGQLPQYLGDEHVRELLESFGELRGFNLIKDPATGMSKVSAALQGRMIPASRASGAPGLLLLRVCGRVTDRRCHQGPFGL